MEELKQIQGLAEKVKEIDFSAPVEWGENVTGVITRLPTDERLIALTFDACGGPYGSRYDQELMNFLIEEEIKATLFFNYRWIQTNLDEFLYLAGLDQFQIANHGTEHRPLSVNGARAWGINGTNSVEEVIDEVMINYEFVKELTGIEMKFYRSGTAFYDEVAVEIVQHLGMSVINYDILGDAGATFSANDVQKALLSSRPGSIVLLHMNQPSSGTAEGVRKAIPMLREQGFRFVTLDEVDGI
ncbi:MAG: polysaccharide deacetylase family protein [Bacillaceae bacterium]|nr:polysaccharide deacetylase family protein [Bacillaceae bacterium]